ncbi:hypothetical protein C8Q74DRAFT_1373413 [Fomes fomentarius]|nr:hypothetical protein C8Q74DRAFT_1373413 [Fomes fomentarius]
MLRTTATCSPKSTLHDCTGLYPDPYRPDYLSQVCPIPNDALLFSSPGNIFGGSPKHATLLRALPSSAVLFSSRADSSASPSNTAAASGLLLQAAD